jgi:6-phosphogluconolactonase/glucosamine-6-phosphate isomerase/deaminase
VDERHVALEHADSNFKQCQEQIFARFPIPKENIFAVDGNK